MGGKAFIKSVGMTHEGKLPALMCAPVFLSSTGSIVVAKYWSRGTNSSEYGAPNCHAFTYCYNTQAIEWSHFYK